MKLFRFITYIIFIACVMPTRVDAGLIINEILYDAPGTDTDHEWVEIYNDSSDAISIEGFKFNDGANHGLNAPPINGGVGSLSVPGNGYVVLAANASVFKSDYPSFSGTLIDTVMALANEGDTLSLVDSNNDVIDTVTYGKSQGGAGDGNSLGSFGSALAPGTPTPGRENTRTTTSANQEEEEEVSEIEKDQEVPLPVFSGTIIVKDPITAGVPTQFSTIIVNPERKIVLPGKYVWNFGDGTVYEYFDGLPFLHTYNDPGEYVVYFEYYKSKGAFTPDVIIKKNISVSEGGMVISSLGTPLDPKVEISNTTSFDTDMSSWKIISGANSYAFPKNTIVMRNKKILLRPSILGFSPLGVVNLVHPSGLIASTKNIFFIPPEYVEVSTAKNSSSVISSSSDSLSKSSVTSELISSGPVDPVESSIEPIVPLEANVLSSIELKSGSKSFLLIFYYGLFVCVIIGGVITVRWIRKTSQKEKKKSDQEYDVDEFTFV